MRKVQTVNVVPPQALSKSGDGRKNAGHTPQMRTSLTCELMEYMNYTTVSTKKKHE